jgi:hypothetical protein
VNLAANQKEALRIWHYAIQSSTERQNGQHQYDWQIYPTALSKLLSVTKPDHLKIIPIGDSDVDGDFWVIPYAILQDLFVSKNLAHGRRWRFQIKNDVFVLYPGNNTRLGEINVSQFRNATLPNLI